MTVRAIRGVLVECDPAIKSLIIVIDSKNHDYIVEDLDDQRVIVKENMVADLRKKLEEMLAKTQVEEPDSSDDSS